jgi:hypothetical protein
VEGEGGGEGRVSRKIEEVEPRLRVRLKLDMQPSSYFSRHYGVASQSKTQIASTE